MCSLAKKVPIASKGKNSTEATANENNRDALVDTINILVAYPEFSQNCAAGLRKQLRLKQTEATYGDGAADDTIQTLSQVDETARATFLGKHLKCSVKAIGEAKAKDPKFPLQAMTCLLNTGNGLQMLPECANKVVLYGALDRRVEAAGNRQAIMMDPVPLVDEVGNVDWAAGVYSPKLDSDGITETVVHRPTGVEVSVDVKLAINNDFELTNNHDDFQAVFWKSKAVNYKVCDFFEGTKTGPYAMKQWKGSETQFQAYVKEAVKEQAALRLKTTDMSVENTEDYKAPTKERRGEGVKRAREMLVKAAAEREKKRRVSIGSASSREAPAEDAELPEAPPVTVDEPRSEAGASTVECSCGRRRRRGRSRAH